jgi:hypothetical protein
MQLWADDSELFAISRSQLFTSVVGDVMDKLGLIHQFLPPVIKPLRDDMVLIGRSMPVLSVDVFCERITGSGNKLMEKPFGLMLEALDDLKPKRKLCKHRFFASKCALGRDDEQARPEARGDGCCAERLQPRYESRFATEFPHIFVGQLRPGLRTALQGRRFSDPH